MTNTAFWRAMHSLAHPISLASVPLLLINDHLLRIQWPSWWTGKLGDFAWLIFAPFICALVVAWLIPQKNSRQEQIVGLLSFGFIGLWFATAKTIPAIHDLTTNTLDSIVGWHGTLGLDPNDLITLPALLVGWQVWKRSASIPYNLRPLGWVALGLGIMSTLATSCAMYSVDSGIEQLCQENGTLYALSNEGIFSSTDGGLTWLEAPISSNSAHCLPTDRRNPQYLRAWLMTNGSTTYRFAPADGIYSYDNQEAEKLEIDLSDLGHDVRRIYYEGYGSGFVLCGRFVAYYPGPIDALIDAQSGNLVAAMGWDGILIKTQSDGWQWITVGKYHYADLTNISPLNFIQPQLLIAWALLILLQPTLAVIMHPISSASGCALLTGWFLFFVTAIFSRFVLVPSPFDIFGIPFWGCVLIGLIFDAVVLDTYRVGNLDNRQLALIVFLSLATVALFLLPYVLWVRGTVPNEATANGFAVVTGMASFVASTSYLRRRFPYTPRKRKNEEL